MVTFHTSCYVKEHQMVRWQTSRVIPQVIIYDYGLTLMDVDASWVSLLQETMVFTCFYHQNQGFPVNFPITHVYVTVFKMIIPMIGRFTSPLHLVLLVALVPVDCVRNKHLLPYSLFICPVFKLRVLHQCLLVKLPFSLSWQTQTLKSFPVFSLSGLLDPSPTGGVLGLSWFITLNDYQSVFWNWTATPSQGFPGICWQCTWNVDHMLLGFWKPTSPA